MYVVCCECEALGPDSEDHSSDDGMLFFWLFDSLEDENSIPEEVYPFLFLLIGIRIRSVMKNSKYFLSFVCYSIEEERGHVRSFGQLCVDQ